jgi:XTP/dITP diphosphohydrolase
MSKLLLASNNQGKLIEIQSLLQGLDVELVTPVDLGLELQVDETGNTYHENALLKGRAFALASGLVTLADDSGLEVDALDGKPGLHSARFSKKPGATDADRRMFLLEKLAGKPRPWLARFRCVVALASPVGEITYAEGLCPGEIIPIERGSNGFGYDPIFLLPELGLTMAELEMAQKNQLSHRARAVRAAVPLIQKMLETC